MEDYYYEEAFVFDCECLDSADFIKNHKYKILRCRNNKLTSLPELSDNLETLDCSLNLIKKLPKLPDSLFFINCS